MRLFLIMVLVFFFDVFFLSGCDQVTAPNELEVPTAFLSPIATMTPEEPIDNNIVDNEKQLIVSQLMETNGNCQGFCFWGILPNRSSFEKTIVYLEEIHSEQIQKNHKNIDQYNEVFSNGNNIDLNIQFNDQQGIVDSLYVKIYGLGRSDVSSRSWLAFRPDNLMKKFGVPKFVLIAMSQGPEGRVGYSMKLVYDQGYIDYDGNQVIYLPIKDLKVCPLRAGNIESLSLQSYKNPENLEIDDGYINISELNNISEIDFYKTMVDFENDGCFTLDYEVYIDLTSNG